MASLFSVQAAPVYVRLGETYRPEGLSDAEWEATRWLREDWSSGTMKLVASDPPYPLAVEKEDR